MKINTIILILLYLISNNIIAGNWVDDWVDQHSVSGSSYFESQKRGYYSGGRFSARWRNSTEYPITIQAPRIRSGCGGIDLFMGGFSFLDPEYLMEKLQRALQAAPAVAFDLALKEACPDCANTIKEFENVINQLNALQMNECSAANKIVKIAKGDDVDITSGLTKVADAVTAAKNATTKLWQNHSEESKANKGKPISTPAQQQVSIQHCPIAFKDIIATQGSLLDNVANKKGLTGYTGHMRALIGDVQISRAGNGWSAQYIEPCPNTNAWDIDGILTGRTAIRTDNTSSCTQSTDKGLYVYTQEIMTNVASKMINNNQILTNDEKAFLSSTNVAVLLQLQQAIVGDRVGITISALREPVAESIAYAVIDDLVTNILDIATLANISANVKGVVNTNATAEDCDTRLFSAIKSQVVDFEDRARFLFESVKNAKIESTKQYVAINQLNEQIMQQDKKRIQFKLNSGK